MTWPNDPTWSAERNKHIVKTDDGDRYTWVVKCGSIYLPSGRLVTCDPFTDLEPGDNPAVVVPPGKYPVTVTLADVSSKLDRSHIREAYATVRIRKGIDSYRRALPMLSEGEEPPEEGEANCFPVDAGTACFVDDWAVANCMPSPDKWGPIFDSWSKRMADPKHLRKGLANIPLPLARNGENIVILNSGWGDGCYPVVGSFDKADRLIAVHIAFDVIQ
jgi:hypothetical protein